MNTPASHETNKNINPALPSTNRAATNGLPTAGFKPANSSGRLIGAVIRYVPMFDRKPGWRRSSITT